MATTTRTIKIKFTGDAKGLVTSSVIAEESIRRVDKAANKASGRFGAFSSSAANASRKFTSATVGFTKGAARMTVMASAAGAAVGSLGELGTAVAATSGSLLALPAAGGVAAASMITLKLGADGVKKAFEGVHKSLDPLRKAVSTTFGQGLEPAVEQLNRTLPQLNHGFVDVAIGMSHIVDAATATISLPKNVAVLNRVLGSTGGLMTNLSAATGPVVQALLDIVDVGLNAFGNLGGGIVGVANKFEDFIAKAKASGQLQQWMQGGINAVKTLASSLAFVAKTAAQVIKSLQPAFEAFKPIIKTVADIFVKDVAPILGDIAQVLGPSLSRVIDAIGHALEIARPGIEAFANGFSDFLVAIVPALPSLGKLASALGTALGDALSKLGPPLAELISAFADQLAAILPDLTPVLIDLAGAFLQILDALTPVIKPLGQIATTVLGALAKVLEKVGPPLAAFVVKLVDELAPYVPDLVDAFLAFVDAVTPLIQPMLDLVLKIMEPLLPLIKPLAKILEGVAGAIGLIAGATGKVLGPLGTLVNFLVDTVTFLPKALASVFKGENGFLANATNEFARLTGISGQAKNTLTADQQEMVNRYLQGIGFMVKGADDFGVSAETLAKRHKESLVNMEINSNDWVTKMNGFFGIVKDGAGKQGSAFSKMATDIDNANTKVNASEQRKAAIVESTTRRILGILQPAAGQIGSIGLDSFSRYAKGAEHGMNEAVSAAGNVPTRVKQELGKQSLYGSGQKLIQGFISGIKSMFGAASSAAGQIAGAVDGWFPHSPAKVGPFSGRGWTPYRGQALVQGFADGMESRTARVTGAASRVVESAARPLAPRLFGTTTNTSGTTSAPAAALVVPEVHVYLGDKELTDLVRVEIAESARGTRRTVLAGSGSVR